VNEYTVLIVAGVTTGAIYALAGLGLVVTYKTSGVFNFAHGAIGIFVAFTFDWLREDIGLASLPALLVCVLAIGPALGAGIERLFLRRLDGASASTFVVVSLGLLVAAQGATDLVFGSVSRSIEPFLPTSTFGLGGVRVGWDQACIVAIAAAAGLLLYQLFRQTQLGLAMRAVVDDGPLTDLVGVDGARIRTGSWMLGAGFASLSAILIAPIIGLDAAILTLLIVRAFAAAAVGRLVSLPLTFAGGIGIGVLESLSTKLAVGHPSLGGLPPSVPFVVLFAVLLLARRGRFVEVVHDRRSGAQAPPLPALRPVVPVAVLVGLALLPSRLGSADLLTATSTVVFFLLFVSLRLLVGLSRQVSLSHAVFVALGASTLANLVDAGVPYLPALGLAGLVLVPLGAVVALPAIRLSGLFLALATFGFGILVQSLVFTTSLAFGDDGVVTITRPELLGVSLRGDRGFYFFALAIVAAGVLLAEAVTRSRLGRVLRAIADSPTATESLGLRVTTARVAAFCLSAFLAGVAGGLLGTLFGSVNATTFGFNQSLLWLTVLVTAGAASLAGSGIAAALLIALPALVSSSLITDYQPVVFGLLAVLLAQSSDGLVSVGTSPRWGRWAAAAAWRTRTSPARDRLRPAPTAAPR
jgi:branched-subunit amino acid ABC-type transport system permease component